MEQKTMSSHYAQAGVDIDQADRGVAALVSVLKSIDTGKPSRSVVPSGHYASVLKVTDTLGIAFATDGVGSKLIVAEQTGRFDTVGIDCVAMNVNDLICIGAEPIALLDYLAVEEAEPKRMESIAIGLKAGAEQAGIEIPGGELAQLPELIKGHPSPCGIDLVGTCIGTVELDQLILGQTCKPGDALIGIPSSGVHSNGLTLARKALLTNGGFELDSTPSELDGESIADVLLKPTTIYVRALLDLISSEFEVKGMAHITGGGFTNLLRLNQAAGFKIDSLPKPPAVFSLIQTAGGVSTSEMFQVFNMGVGMCCVVDESEAEQTCALLSKYHPGTVVIGSVTDQVGRVELTQNGLIGDSSGFDQS